MTDQTPAGENSPLSAADSEKPATSGTVASEPNGADPGSFGKTGGDLDDSDPAEENFRKRLVLVEEEIESLVRAVGAACGTDVAFPMLSRIGSQAVEDAFDRIQEYCSSPCESLVVVLDSEGGDIHAAYNLACLFRRCRSKKLVIVVPRWAKSAATLLACAGDELVMSAIAELGPLDPQWTVYDQERRENFSPLDIESTLELIRGEYDKGHNALADALVNRLQYPMTLGRYKHSLEVAQDYIQKVLLTGALQKRKTDAERIAKHLSTGYADHAYCINIDEASALGLDVTEASGDLLRAMWALVKQLRKRESLREMQRKHAMLQRIKQLPADVLARLGLDLGDLVMQKDVDQ